MGKIKEITTFTTKIDQPKKIFIGSDWHREITEGQLHLDQLKEQLKPMFNDLDFIILPGDLVNDVNDLKDPEFRKIFISALKEFTENKTTIVSLGNHDKMTREGPESWNQGEEHLIIDALKELKNVVLLRNNQTYQLGKIRFGSFSPNCSYYLTKKERKEEYAKQFYANFDEKKFGSETYNIFLIHEPHSIIELSEEKEKCIQPNTDLVVSGHMHDGLLPTFLHKFAKNRGGLSPQMELFPKYAQGEYTVGETDFILNGAINTRVETPIINKMYGPSATLLTIESSEKRQKIKRYN